ncbi:MAG: class IIb bacteriocin, lactobin A/cerein 7B family [Proteobacteria bacterium]|nr:class IIb bacteriocin, lactobin A/cerein 7B family [Pseudomonadota bacterium]
MPEKLSLLTAKPYTIIIHTLCDYVMCDIDLSVILKKKEVFMTRILINAEIEQVSGGKFNFGSIISTLVVGIVTGGPVGLGIAASGLVMAQGIDNLADLINK